MDAWIERQENDCFWQFKASADFDEILASNLRCWDFLEWMNAEERCEEAIYTDVACCVAQKANSVSPFEVALTLIVKRSDSLERSVVVSGQGLLSLETTMSRMVQWLSQDPGSDQFDVTIKAFASQPRQLAPTIPRISGLGTVRFHFLHFKESVQFEDVKEIEFRQCTHLPEVWASHSFSDTTRRITMSCSMPELANFVLPQKVPEVDLVLHFFLTGPPWDKLCSSLQTNTALQSLSIQYLDISDADWLLLMTSLREHPSLRSLTMGFTDAFVDNYRRLTPERRRTRSEAVLSTVRANECLTEITWPVFQQDEEVALQIAACLASKRSTD